MPGSPLLDGVLSVSICPLCSLVRVLNREIALLLLASVILHNSVPHELLAVRDEDAVEPLSDRPVRPERYLGHFGKVGGVEEDELDVVHGGRAEQREDQHAVVFGRFVVAILGATARILG